MITQKRKKKTDARWRYVFRSAGVTSGAASAFSWHDLEIYNLETLILILSVSPSFLLSRFFYAKKSQLGPGERSLLISLRACTPVTLLFSHIYSTIARKKERQRRRFSVNVSISLSCPGSSHPQTHTHVCSFTPLQKVWSRSSNN